MRAWLLVLAALPLAAQWSQFRGPNGSGVAATAHNLPVEFSPEKNVVWKTAIPAGHSSPVIAGDRIFITAVEGEQLKVTSDKVIDIGQGKLWTICLDRRTGEILWKKQAPATRSESRQRTNSAASPSPVTDGRSVISFFGAFGLISYDLDGHERWRQPLGPFVNENGQGTSPIIADKMVVLVCDQDAGSFAATYDIETGRQRWRIDRPHATRGFGTPVVYRPKTGPPELLINGAFRLDSYNLQTGEILWWVRGLSWHPKSIPAIGGDMIFVTSADRQGEAETPTETPTYKETLAQYDANKDGILQNAELPPALAGTWGGIDLDLDGVISEREWDIFRGRQAARNALLAIRYGGKGDLTSTNVVWSMRKFLPTTSSPLYYDGVLYLLREGGILTSLNPATGAILKQRRLMGALDDYWASPIVGDGKIYAASDVGMITVIKPGAQWEVLAQNDLDDTIFATPAIVEDRIYVRTRSTLYCFANRP